MPGSLNLPDDSKVALTADVKDRGGFADANAAEVWTTSDPTVVALDTTSGPNVVVSSVGGPGTTCTVGFEVQDASGAAVVGPDGTTPIGDTLTINVVASGDTSGTIVPGAVTPK